MIANYGYMDGSGDYYITVDTGKCASCGGKPCTTACPRKILVETENDYGDRVMAVKEDARKSLKHECAGCKPSGNRQPLPCVSSCPFEAIQHSW